MTDYEEGQYCAECYFNSKVFASFIRDITGADAIKLYRPPVTESLMMVSTPMPKDRADWIKGFDDWMKENRKGESDE